METEHALGWLPDVPKPSDYTDEHPQVAPLLAATALASRVARIAPRKGKAAAAPPAAPAMVDLRAWFSPIEDQGAAEWRRTEVRYTASDSPLPSPFLLTGSSSSRDAEPVVPALHLEARASDKRANIERP